MAQRTTKKLRRPRGNEILKVGIIGVSLVLAAFILKEPQVERASLNPVIVEEFDSIQVPVPREPVPAGTDLSKVDVELVSYPRHQVPDGAIIEAALLSGYENSVPLPAQLPIFSANLRPSGSVSLNAVEEKIPPGMRAMTIKVDATIAVEGWAAPGSVVDVLLVQEDKTTVVAERVKILSAERSVEEMQEGGPRVPSTVTVLVTQEQCLAINTAIPLGRIAFALRSSQDEESWSSRTFTAANLNKTRKEATVSGFVSVQGHEGGSRSYALSDGKWIVAETKPDGFLVAGE